jgi:hypothetical protein
MNIWILWRKVWSREGTGAVKRMSEVMGNARSKYSQSALSQDNEREGKAKSI